jgi:hypothetical protein
MFAHYKEYSETIICIPKRTGAKGIRQNRAILVQNNTE